MTRTQIIKGPAMILYRTAKIFTKDDVVVTHRLGTFNIDTSAFGKADERAIDREVEATFTPCGELDVTTLAALFPYTSTAFGTSVLGATGPGTAGDAACYIVSRGGGGLTIVNAYVRNMPDVMLAANKTAFGSVTIAGIGADGSAWSDADSLVINGVGANTFDASAFDTSEIVTGPAVVTLPTILPDGFALDENGIRFNFSASMSPIKTDKDGTVDVLLGAIEATAQFTPVNIDTDSIIDAMSFQGGSATRGRSLASYGQLLTATVAGGLIVTFPKAAPKQNAAGWGSTVPRSGELSLVAVRLGGTGDLFSVAHA